MFFLGITGRCCDATPPYGIVTLSATTTKEFEKEVPVAVYPVLLRSDKKRQDVDLTPTGAGMPARLGQY